MSFFICFRSLWEGRLTFVCLFQEAYESWDWLNFFCFRFLWEQRLIWLSFVSGVCEKGYWFGFLLFQVEEEYKCVCLCVCHAAIAERLATVVWKGEVAVPSSAALSWPAASLCSNDGSCRHVYVQHSKPHGRLEWVCVKMREETNFGFSVLGSMWEQRLIWVCLFQVPCESRDDLILFHFLSYLQNKISVSNFVSSVVCLREALI